MAQSWRLAESIKIFRDQVNALAPNRSRASDGTIGDAAHAATKSEHNPEDHDSNPATPGVVRAIDITHDVAGGMDCQTLVDMLVANKDPRILYIIFNGRMWRSYAKPNIQPWVPAPYTGSNKHTKHMHLSVVADPALFDSPAAWRLTPPVVSTTQPAPGTDMVTRSGTGTAVAVGGGFFVTAGAWVWNAFGWLGLGTFIVLLIALLYLLRKPIGRLLFRRSK